MTRALLKITGLAVATTAAVLGLWGAGLDSSGGLNPRGFWLFVAIVGGFGVSMVDEILGAVQERKEAKRKAAEGRAERKWNYLETERFKTLRLSFFLKRPVPVPVFLEELQQLTVNFVGEPEAHVRVHEFVHFPQLGTASDAHNLDGDSSRPTSTSSRAGASLWRLYERQPGYWWKSTDHRWDASCDAVAGFDVDVDWTVLPLSKVETVQDLSHLRTFGVQLPRGLFKAGFEELTVSFRTPTFQHDLDFSKQGLDALAELYPQIEFVEAASGGSVCDTVGVSLSGAQLLELFRDDYVARSAGSRKPRPYRGMMGVVQPGTHREAYFFPTMPVDCPETRDYSVTLKVPRMEERRSLTSRWSRRRR